MKSKRKRSLSDALPGLVLLISLIPVWLAGASGPDLEQLRREMTTLGQKLEEGNAWPAARQTAYRQSLAALREAFLAAATDQCDQIKVDLAAISTESARPPLEGYLHALEKEIGQIKADISRQTAAAEGEKPPPAGAETRMGGQRPAPGGSSDGAGKNVTISGTVTLNPPQKDVLVTVTVVNEKLKNPSQSSKTDSDGKMTFDFPPLPAANYRLAVSAPGYLQQTQEIQAQQNVQMVQTLQPCSGEIRIQILDKWTQKPIANARASLLVLSDTSVPEYIESSGYQADHTQADKGLITLTGLNGAGRYKVVVQRKGYLPFIQRDPLTPGSTPVKVSAELVREGGSFERTVFGLEQAGASSAESQQNVFVDLFYSHPLITTDWDSTKTLDPANKPPMPRLNIWGDVRLTSTPQPAQDIFVATLNGTLADSLSSGDGATPRLITAVSFQAGLQCHLVDGFLGGTRFDVSLIGGGGAITPLSPEDRVEMFGVPDSVKDATRFNDLVDRLLALDPTIVDKYSGNDGVDPLTAFRDDLKSKKNIAFVLKDRDRFLRNYFAGLRFQTCYNEVAPIRSPAFFDVTIGQDESVTGGRMRGSVLRLDGFVPITYKKKRLLYLFATGSLALRRTRFSDHLFLPQSDGTLSVSSPETYVFAMPAANRDQYRLGAGLNLLELFGE